MLYVMAGEDEIDDLQDQKDGRFYENTLADEGGTGQLAGYGDSYIDELTDTDERPAKQSVQQGNDASSEFANFGDDAFDMVDRDDKNDADNENLDGGDEDFDNDAEDFDGADDDYDNEYGYDDYEDEDENNEEDDDDGESGDKGKKGKNGKDKGKKGKGDGSDKGQFTKVKKKKLTPEEKAKLKAEKEKKFAKQLGVKFIWHEGEEITLETLQQYWTVFAIHVESLRELMNQADINVDVALSASTGGPNMIIKMNKYISRVFGGAKSGGMIQSILNLIGNSGMILACGVVASISSMVTQQWGEVALIFALKAGLTLALKEDFVQSLMQKIFSLGMEELKKKFKFKDM